MKKTHPRLSAKSTAKKSAISSRHQDYNNILREELDIIFPAFLRRYFDIRGEVKLKAIEESKAHRTKLRDPDFLKIKLDQNGQNEAVYHLELHVKDDKKLIHRCCEFDAMKVRELDLPIFTCVLFLGKRRSRNIPTELRRGSIFYQMRVIDLHAEPVEDFLNSKHPAEVMWGILADFGPREPLEVIRALVRRIAELTDIPADLEKYSSQLEILADLRTLQPETIKAINSDMSIYEIFDIRKSIRYQNALKEGLEQGIEQGIEQGLEQGIEQGIEQQNRLFAKSLIKGTDFDDEKIASLAGVEVEFVAEIRAEMEGKKRAVKKPKAAK